MEHSLANNTAIKVATNESWAYVGIEKPDRSHLLSPKTRSSLSSVGLIISGLVKQLIILQSLASRGVTIETGKYVGLADSLLLL